MKIYIIKHTWDYPNGEGNGTQEFVAKTYEVAREKFLEICEDIRSTFYESDGEKDEEEQAEDWASIKRWNCYSSDKDSYACANSGYDIESASIEEHYTLD